MHLLQRRAACIGAGRGARAGRGGGRARQQSVWLAGGGGRNNLVAWVCGSFGKATLGWGLLLLGRRVVGAAVVGRRAVAGGRRAALLVVGRRRTLAGGGVPWGRSPVAGRGGAVAGRRRAVGALLVVRRWRALARGRALAGWTIAVWRRGSTVARRWRAVARGRRAVARRRRALLTIGALLLLVVRRLRRAILALLLLALLLALLLLLLALLGRRRVMAGRGGLLLRRWRRVGADGLLLWRLRRLGGQGRLLPRGLRLPSARRRGVVACTGSSRGSHTQTCGSMAGSAKSAAPIAHISLLRQAGRRACCRRRTRLSPHSPPGCCACWGCPGGG